MAKKLEESMTLQKAKNEFKVPSPFLSFQPLIEMSLLVKMKRDFSFETRDGTKKKTLAQMSDKESFILVKITG